MRTLFALNPALNRPAIAAALASHGRVQIRDALLPDAAEAIHEVLARGTDWGLAWGAAAQSGEHRRGADLRAMSPQDQARFGLEAARAAAAGQFAFLYAQYPMVEAYVKGWNPGHPLDLLLEHLNSPEMLDFAREVTGHASIIKADAQATLYAPGHFLTAHDDANAGANANEGRLVAYVLSLAHGWRADFGGMLNFLDAGDDIIEGWVPRFNTLNLFTVPQRHAVSSVVPFAPVGRFSITGWFRDR